MANAQPVRVPHGACVFVGDGRKALFLRNEGNPMAPRLKTMHVLKNDNPPTRELGTDKPGRSLARMSPRRSAMEQTDWHEQDEQRFLADLAGRLDAAVTAGETKSVIVVAPPRALGVLRQAYSDGLRHAVRAEIDKDYVKMPVHEIEKALAA